VSESRPRFVPFRLAVKAVTPPVLWSLLKRGKDALVRTPEAPVAEPEPEPAKPAAPPEWEYVPEGWARAAGGWDVDAIARVYRAKWPSFLLAVAGPGPLGVNHEIELGTPVPRDDRNAQQTVLAFGYALERATHGKASASMLDWGGGPGHYAVLGRAVAPEVELEYHSRDLPALTALGRELLPTDSFHDDDACFERHYDLVVASSSLQYAEDWQATVGRLAAVTDGYLYVARVPVAFQSPSFVVLQRAYAYGYETEYLGWVLNRDDLIESARRSGLELVREFLLPNEFSAIGAPESPIEHRGFLFAKFA
jgi:putative methyltransferase (TIGR04325 family)